MVQYVTAELVCRPQTYRRVKQERPVLEGHYAVHFADGRRVMRSHMRPQICIGAPFFQSYKLSPISFI